MRRFPLVLLLAAAVTAGPAPLAGQAVFGLGARGGYTGLTGADFDGASAALFLDLSLRYGKRHGISGAAGGYFSNHDVADAKLDVIGVYLEGRWTFPTMSTNVLPFVTLRGGYTRDVFTTGSGATTQDAIQNGYAIGGTAGVDYEISDKLDIEVAGLYAAVALDDAKVNGNVTPGTERRGGQWAVLVGVVFRSGSP